jgi:hypothetical protein
MSKSSSTVKWRPSTLQRPRQRDKWQIGPDPIRRGQILSSVRFPRQFLAQYHFGTADCVAVRVYIDGNFAGGTILQKCKRHHQTFGSTIIVNCLWEGSGPSAKKLQYHFADLETRKHHHFLAT